MNTASEVPPRINPCRSIAYQITRWDLFASFMTILLRHRTIQVFLLVTMIFSGFLFLAPGLGTQPFSLTIIYGVIFLIGFLVILAIASSIMGLALAFLAKQHGVVGQHVLEITEQGLIERTEFNEGLHKWPCICRIMSLCGYLFIYMSDNVYHQVPKRYFSPEEIDGFEAELRARAKQVARKGER